MDEPRTRHEQRSPLWRRALVLLTSAVMFAAASGQTTVTVGTGTTTTTGFPITSCYGYSYTQNLYLASEILSGGGFAGSISKIRFYYATAMATPTTSNAWTIYMGNTPNTSLAIASAIPTSSMSQVFSGTVTYPAAGNWMEITLTTPFVWNGTDNLVVAVDENAPSYSCSAGWRYTSTAATRGIRWYSDTANPDPTLLPGTYSGSTGTLAGYPNIQVDVTSLSACAGTPTPGNTTGPTGACSGISFNLGLQNATTGSGVTYQWQYDNGGGWTNFGPNLPSASTSQTVATSYRCIVTCANDPTPGMSNPLAVPMNPFYTCYCNSAFTSVTYEFITNVTYAGINNSSAGNTGGPVNYTSQVATVYTGTSNQIAVTVDPDALDYIYAFIDWDQNGILNDPGEVYTIASSINTAGPHTLNITVPGTAMTGQTRMRVMIDYNNATPNPCRNATYGEAEDYTVDVQMATCTPPVATIIRDDSNCPNFTLSADITSLGSATDVSVSYSVNGGPASSVGPFSSTGVQTIGTFGTGQSVAVTLVHDQDAQCNVALGTFSPLGLCNDFCSNATPITCAMSPVSGTSVGSTQDPIPCTLAGNTFNQLQQAVWYKYVGDDQQVTLNTCGTGTLTDSRLTVFDGTCGSLNCVAGNDDMGAACGIGTLHSQVQWNAFSGNTYYIAVHAYGATTTGTFTLNLTCTPLCLPVPVNDDCANAIPLAVGSSCSPVAGSTQCASASATANPTCISTFATAPDVFYSFTAGDVTQIASFGNITAGNLGLALYDACGGTSLYCQASSVSGQDIILPSLTIGNMYILRVFSLLTQEGGFDICLRNPCQPPSVSVTPTYSDCASATPGQTSVMVDVTAVGTDPTLDIVVNGSTVQSGVGVGSYGPYAYPSGTPVTVNVVTDDSFCDQSFGPYINTNNCVVCDGPILDYTFCYPDNMNQSWLFESDGGGGNFALHFISGTIESSSFDHLTIYDGPNNTYPVLFNHASGTTSLAGITAMATGTNIYMVATSDGSVSCGSGSFSGDPWHWQVYCLSCDLPQASVVGTDVDCLTGTYTVDVNVTSIGDAPDVDIVSDLNGLDPNGDDVGVGVHTVGPFPVGTPVNLSVVHNGNNACNITLPAVNPNSNCIACNNTPLAQTYCYGPSDAQNWSYTSDGNGTLVLSFQSGSIESSTFDHLTIYDGSSNAAPILYDHVGATENLAGLMVVATGNALYMEMDSDSSVQCSTNPAWQWNWTVQCVDCTFPQATATLLSNCGGGNFTIQVDVTNASNAGNVNITTDYIGDTEPTGVGNGTYVLGPYPLGTVVQLDVAHPTNAFCTLDLGEFTDCCNGTCGGATQAILGTNTAGKLDCGNGASNLGTDEYGASTGATNARWFYYDATQTGTLLATSCASGIDTRVKFHDGNGGCGSLVPLSANDDDCFPSSTTGYFVSPGDHVLIEWDDRWSDSGFDWDLSFAPCTPDPNLDLCSTQNPASRQVSIGSGETWTGTLDCLSADDIIPNPYSNTWGWGWAAFELTECANVRVDYCGTASFGFGSLNMYGDCGNLFINSQSYDFSTCGDGNPTIFFNNLTPGFYYYPILWSPPNNAVGPFTVNVSAFTPTVACASNLTACSATPVACNDVVTGNTDNLFPSLPANACPFPNGATSGGSLWYSYTATQDENVILSTCGAATTFDTRISVFEGPDCSTLSCYTLGDDKGGACTNRTQIEFFAQSGQTYWIAVHSTSPYVHGTFELAVGCDVSCPRPVNDNCMTALGITSFLADGSGTYTFGDNSCAMNDAMSSCVPLLNNQGMWYSFFSGNNGIHYLDLHTQNEDGSLTATTMNYVVYNGGCSGALQASGQVACTVGGNGDYVLLSGLAPSTNYLLRVDNAGDVGFEGTFSLRVQHPGLNDAGITVVTDPFGLQCSSTLVPHVTLKNFGEATLTGVDIHYDVDGLNPQVYHWTGALPYLGTTAVALPGFVSPYGVHTLNVYTALPNGAPDEIAANDLATSNVDVTGETVIVEITTDNDPSGIYWEIYDAGYTLLADAYTNGPIYTPNTTTPVTLCITTIGGNHFYFFLYDFLGDGLSNTGNGNGRWRLRNQSGGTLIGDRFDGTIDGFATPTFTPLSASYNNGHEFDLPSGPSNIQPSECNVFTNTLQSKVYTSPVGGVTGYQFEFSDPDAGFIRRIARPYNWVKFGDMVTYPLLPGVTYFARVRVDQGAAGYGDDHWGTGCEMGIDPNQVPGCTGLIDDITLPTHSCGVTRAFGGSDKVWAQPVVGATQYRFKFVNIGESFTRIITKPSYALVLSWVTFPLTNGVTYDVSVECLVNGQWSGYCGPVCQVTIQNPSSALANRSEMLPDGSELMLWPNPVRDGQVNLLLNGLTDDTQRVTIDVYDMFGKRVRSIEQDNSGEVFNTVLDMQGVASGIYLVNVTVNGRLYQHRVNVQ